ncbi:MAG: SUMF1/EgtB/PvdO family nonheme iron enzyme, partial [Myxococcota bacterium]
GGRHPTPSSEGAARGRLYGRSHAALVGRDLGTLVLEETPKMKRALLIPLAVALTLSCGPDRFTAPEPDGPPSTVVDLDNAPGDLCAQDLMVAITLSGGRIFCIDRFESAIDGAVLGNAAQGTSDEDRSLDGSTSATARVALQVEPRADVSWYQARAACENAGKRLCTTEEWERACRGPNEQTYPYGDSVDDDACNGFFKSAGDGVLLTGSLDSCGTAEGVYDLSGNLSEWTDDSVERVPGDTILSDRAVRGGSFQSNFAALRCFGAEFHEPPGTLSREVGFRCCDEPG